MTASLRWPCRILGCPYNYGAVGDDMVGGSKEEGQGHGPDDWLCDGCAIMLPSLLGQGTSLLRSLLSQQGHGGLSWPISVSSSKTLLYIPYHPAHIPSTNQCLLYSAHHLAHIQSTNQCLVYTFHHFAHIPSTNQCLLYTPHHCAHIPSTKQCLLYTSHHLAHIPSTNH